MKKKNLLLIFALLLVIILVGASVGYKKLAKNYEGIGQAVESGESESINAPDFTVLDGNMEEVKLSDLKGKPTVVNFWATWCGYCIVEMPHFDEAYNKYKDDINFMMVDLTDGQRETVDAAKKFIKETGYTFPVYYDTGYSAATAYGTYSIPMTVFVNKDGTISNVHKGAMDKQMLIAYIEKMK